MYTNIFSFGERILSEYRTREGVLSNSVARSMTLIRCVFNKVFLVNHWRDNHNCGYVLVTLLPKTTTFVSV